MPFSAYPTAPDINRPADFPAEATAWWAHHAGTFVPEMESAMLAYGPGVPFCSVGGTANAITLASGLNLASLADGQMVRFRAPAANTAAFTINLDGLGAKAGLTITGAAPPVGYIRVGTGADAVETVARYRAASDSWIVSRELERGSNANGDFVKRADGEMVCNGAVTSTAANIAAGNVFRSDEIVWTFPATFSTTTNLVVTHSLVSGSPFWGKSRYSTTSAGAVQVFYVASTTTAITVPVAAVGRWY